MALRGSILGTLIYKGVNKMGIIEGILELVEKEAELKKVDKVEIIKEDKTLLLQVLKKDIKKIGGLYGF